MNFPQITMQSTFAKIGINTQNAQLTIEQPPAELSIEQPPAEMVVEKTPSRLTIDQLRARADVDLKSAQQRIAETAQEGHLDVQKGIARRVQEGEQLMQIENSGNPIAQQANQHKIISEHEFGLGWIPSWGSVNINYDPGRLDINWKINKPIINSQSYRPIINYYPGKVDIQMKQYPSLNIDIGL
ncbi:DUF6470 family protein [Bacillus sp. EB600]|uniref:DUF6470 family protein n=1 Tax=Bacillus sp. EB600 TaxID=2806345 RepID=UPI00210F1B4F|nr:DUF6470 family protein [Bacillus sp. EB600]MCQ6278694.1 hypothetical protein [Bacillus sp. EB600]